MIQNHRLIVLLSLLIINQVNAQTLISDSALNIGFRPNRYDTAWNVARIEPGGGRGSETMINGKIKFDTLPSLVNNQIRQLTSISIKKAFNPVFSPDDKMIAFGYGWRKIAIVDPNGGHFKQICEECFRPQWLSNEWIIYYKDFKYLYKKNVFTDEEIQLTKEQFPNSDYKLSPDKKWLAYTDFNLKAMSDTDRLGHTIVYSAMDGAGNNLCLLSIDAQTSKFVTSLRTYVDQPCWTPDGDTVLFYIEGQKYYATNLNDNTVRYYPYNALPNISLSDYSKIVHGVFPYSRNCQIIEIDRSNMTPKRILAQNSCRYRDLIFSHDLRYLLFSKTDRYNGDYSLWIEEIK